MRLNRRVLIATTLSVSLLSLVFLDYYWQQISPFAPPIVITLMLITGIWVLVKLISTSITVIKLRHNITLQLVAPTLIYLFTILLIIWHPRFMNPREYLSKAKYQGCYEGTMNTGVILFRESLAFEYTHVGFLGNTIFEKGIWYASGDTLFIEFDDKVPEFVGNKLLMTNERFIKIDDGVLLKNQIGFYRGPCKGLN